MASLLSAANAISLRQLSYVVALAESLNFTRAAERCFVTQSTLSSGIRELERALDAVLFERDRQSVSLTALGKDLVLRAHGILGQTLDLVNAAQAAAGPFEGTVTLGAIPTIAPFLLPPLLRQIRQELPALTTLLREEQTPELLRAVADGEMDFALIALPVDVGRLQVYPLFGEELWLIAAESDPLAHVAHLRAGQIDLARLMLLGEGHCLREHSLEACLSGRRGKLRVPSAIEASSLPTLVQMVEAGLGVALLPEMAIKAGFLVGSKVIARPLAAPAPRRDIVLVARPSTPRSALLLRLQALAAAGPHVGTARGARRSRLKSNAPTGRAGRT
jgi:LysR family hydrogen peroxide-inducible transcriptional activator